jgi:hypothetical protein
MKKAPSREFGLAASLAMGVMLATGCGSSSDQTASVTSPTTTASAGLAAPTRPNIGGAIVYRSAEENIGPHETDDNGSMRIRLLSVDRNAQPPPYAEDIVGLKRGYKFIKVHLSLQNIGDHTEAQSGLEYVLLDAEGNTRQAFDGGYEPRLGNAGTGWSGNDMQPGDRAVGYLGFNAPPSFHPTELRVVAAASEEAEPASWRLGR